MARVEKKEKKEKNIKKPLMITAISLVSVAAIVGIVFLVMYLLEPGLEQKFTDSRSITANTLTEIIDESSSTASRYENTIYVYVFHSDYDTYPDNDVKSDSIDLINGLITKDKELKSLYDDVNLDKEARIGFYTLDIMDEEDNEDDDFISILNNSDFGNKSGGPFIIKIERQRVTVMNSSQLYQDLYEYNALFTGEIEKYTPKENE